MGRVHAVEKYRLDEIPSAEVRRTCRASGENIYIL